MKALTAVPFLLLSLLAAAPASAQEIRLETAAERLPEVFAEFGIDEVNLIEDAADYVTFELVENGYLFHISVRDEDRVVIYAFWQNEEGLRRSTLMSVNQWNLNSWSSKATINDEGRFLLTAVLPIEMETTEETLLDSLDIFLSDMRGFDEVAAQ